MKRLLLLGLGALLVTACSSNGSAGVNGTVLGTGISPSSAIVVADTEILISSNGDVCTDLQQNANRRNSQNLIIGVTGTISEGTFPIDHATFQAFDSACNAPVDTTTVSGTVTITAVKQSTLNVTGAVNGATGSFDITFGSDHITGTFDAGDCNLSAVPTPTACN